MNDQFSQLKKDRRKFLRSGCLITAGTGLAVCGGGTAVLSIRPKVEMLSMRAKAGTGGKRILIAYASKAGSTADTANRMGEHLSNQGLYVDVLSVKQVNDLAAYQVVILGSAIRMGSLLPDTIKFVENHQVGLKEKAFSVFILCMTLHEDTETNRTEASSYLDDLRGMVQPASEGLFAGVLENAHLTLLERFMMQQMKSTQGDYRNWSEIYDWLAKVPGVE